MNSLHGCWDCSDFAGWPSWLKSLRVLLLIDCNSNKIAVCVDDSYTVYPRRHSSAMSAHILNKWLWSSWILEVVKCTCFAVISEYRFKLHAEMWLLVNIFWRWGLLTSRVLPVWTVRVLFPLEKSVRHPYCVILLRFLLCGSKKSRMKAFHPSIDCSLQPWVPHHVFT